MVRFIIFIFLVILALWGFGFHPLLGIVMFIGVLISLGKLMPRKQIEHNPYEKYKGKYGNKKISSSLSINKDRKSITGKDSHKESPINEIATTIENTHPYDDKFKDYKYEFDFQENNEIEIEEKERRVRERKEQQERLEVERRHKDEKKRRREVEDEAYFYRRHGGPQWKIDAADDELGRSQFERDYEDEKWEHVCEGCSEPERYCKCCRKCDSYPCQCCDTCGYADCRCCSKCEDYPCSCCDECGQPERYCKCCRKCDSYPCQCCDTCGYADCRCCSKCEEYPCDCCDECGQPSRYCKCCRQCNSYPCECCDTCGSASCRCCYRCRDYPCSCE